MMPVGYLFGITSDGKLSEECAVNLAYRWYLGYDLDEATPNQSVISKAGARFGKKVCEEFFQEAINRCLEKGLVGGEKIFPDGTLTHKGQRFYKIVGDKAGYSVPVIESDGVC
jgi:transposase